MSTKAKTKRAKATLTSIAVGEFPRQSVPRESTHHLGLPLGTPVYALTIFLGAFLFFQVQLILAKFVLPRFGGGPSVWSTALLIFQVLLLAGYGYAVALTQRFTRRTQSRIHFGLLVASAFPLPLMSLKWHSPILPFSTAAPSAGPSPVLQIVLL